MVSATFSYETFRTYTSSTPYAAEPRAVITLQVEHVDITFPFVRLIVSDVMAVSW